LELLPNAQRYDDNDVKEKGEDEFDICKMKKDQVVAKLANVPGAQSQV